ncbi:MAG: phospho-sugar mutase, partial [Chthoniobacterales bacterium]
MSDLPTSFKQAVSEGKLLEASLKNIHILLEQSDDPLYEKSILELAQNENWEELNNRFFQTLAFGTGGLRGKTIGNTVTNAERGTPQSLDRPEFPCVGTNAVNYYNISRATQGLAAYLKEWFRKEGLPGKPKVCISYDTRYFSPEFANRTAKVLTENGCDALLFESPRSTPELSFAVRMHGASAGINLTASHNPPAYNGYKVYFADGAQVVEPHASGIIKKVNAVESEAYKPLNQTEQGKIKMLGAETDEAYMERLKTLTLNPELVRSENRL